VILETGKNLDAKTQRREGRNERIGGAGVASCFLCAFALNSFLDCAPMRIQLHGEELDLHAERALYWPRRRTLIVADVHLGKDAVFRRAGLPIPAGSVASDLARLEALVDRFAAERLLVLGDLLHAPLHPAKDAEWVEQVAAFRARHASLAFEGVRGNHDRAPERIPSSWNLRWLDDATHEAPFVFMHDARDDDRGYALGGHLHPVMRLNSATDSLRLPVFWMRARYGVLPSFGGFTGGHPIGSRVRRGERIYAVAPEGVIDIGQRTAGCASLSRPT
jgi:DNA ligase-associated metallophosphoesterase